VDEKMEFKDSGTPDLGIDGYSRSGH
jgi:hypothetical protein